MNESKLGKSDHLKTRYKLLRKSEYVGQSKTKKGIYLDRKTGRTVFIKFHDKSKMLDNEYAYQNYFYKLVNKPENMYLLKGLGIVIPKPIKIINKSNKSVLVMENITGSNIYKIEDKVRTKVYMSIFKLLELTNKVKINSDLRRFKIRPSTIQLLSIPYFLIKNLLFYGNNIRLFLKSTIFILKQSHNWISLKSNFICHGDINVTNILLKGSKIVLLDFSCVLISHKFYDISKSLNSSWFSSGFHNNLLNNYIKYNHLTINDKKLLKTFRVFNLMQRLSIVYKNKKQSDFYLSTLRRLICNND